MNIEQVIENGQGMFYHELGHLISYFLANKTTSTELGKVEKLEVGFEMNRVCPSERLYHFEQTKVGREALTLNTKNVDRTVAWFIEVIAGCTFQCSFEEKDFKLCFGHESGKIGAIDFFNLSATRNISAFKWTFDQIYEMQKDFQDLLEKHRFIEKIKPIVANIKSKVKDSPNNQITIEGKELESINLEFEEIVTDEILADYLKLISVYKDKMHVKASR